MPDTHGIDASTRRTNLATYEKFADQAEKDDAKLDQVAAQLLKLGEPTLQTLTSAIIAVDGQTQAVQEGFDKGWPKRVVQIAFTRVGTDMFAVDETIKKGEIFSKSADTLLSRRKDAFEPGTITACGKVDTLKTAIEDRLAKLRPCYAKAIDDLRDFGSKLKAMPG